MTEVVDLRTRSTYQPNYGTLARQRIRSARRALDLSAADFAALLTPRVGWPVSAEVIEAWETNAVPPGDVLVAASAATDSPDDEHLIGRVLGLIPPSFTAEALSGHWVTSFMFNSGSTLRRHVDIAQITAKSDRFMAISNHPPAPRSEGRAFPFCNDLEAQLTNRHLVGHWKNSNDTRYFGTFHLAVLPGENVMTGYYTGFGSDVEVSTGPWKWVRLDDAAIAGVDLSAVKLCDPAELGARIEDHSKYDPRLTLADIEQEH